MKDNNSIKVNVYVTPKSGRDEIFGPKEFDTGVEIVIKVRAAAEKGKANEAVCKVVAAYLGIAKSSVSVISGNTSRHKRLEIKGIHSLPAEWTNIN